MKKGYLLLIIFLIFILSTAVRYWPIYHKGFSSSIEVDNLILARNLSLTGEYKIDNEKNVILSSEIVREKGMVSGFGNQFTPILYSAIFNIFGFDRGLPLYVSLFLYGIISVLLFVLVLKLFNIKIVLLFSFFEIFSPLIVQYSTRVGLYEWAMLFLTTALLIYIWKEKPNLLKLFLIGLLFALATLARNSFLIIPFVFYAYDFWKNKSFKRIIIFVLPLLILWGIYLGPGFLKGSNNNDYLSSNEKTSDYMHIFPDSYTFNFERDDYVKSIMGSDQYNYDYSEFLLKYRYKIGLKNTILMYWASIKSYPVGALAQTTFGGPIMILLIILGGFYLYKNKKDLLKLFLLWTGFLYVFLILTRTNHWGHLITLQFPFFLLSALGLYFVFDFVKKQNFKNVFKYLLISGIVLTLFIHLIQSDKWMFHENYENSNMEETLGLVDLINKNDNINKKIDVIAVGLKNPATSIINWYTDYSYVYFDSKTIEKLLTENKLQWAFDQYGVTRIIGYDKDLTKAIINQTKASEI